MVIDDEEGKLLATASCNMLAEFDIAPDPKTQAIIGMIIAAATVYGPRVIMIRARLAQEEKEKESGKAGVYNPDGSAAGMTDFSIHPAPVVN